MRKREKSSKIDIVVLENEIGGAGWNFLITRRICVGFPLWKKSKRNAKNTLFSSVVPFLKNQFFPRRISHFPYGVSKFLNSRWDLHHWLSLGITPNYVQLNFCMLNLQIVASFFLTLFPNIVFLKVTLRQKTNSNTCGWLKPRPIVSS